MGTTPRTRKAEHQLDLLDLLNEIDPPPPPAKPPVIFGHRGRTLLDYRVRLDRWCAENGTRLDCLRMAHAWAAQYGTPVALRGQCHPIRISASLGCPHHVWDGGPCECVGGHVYRTICEHCGWHSPATDDSSAVLAGLDHAYPGWRTSPIAPAQNSGGSQAKAKRWAKNVVELYGDRPLGWPVITDRAGPGLRAVEGRSPWGGYDVAAAYLADGGEH
ncbi:MAG: DUF6349 family protein [Gordonia sp. (in: high G+C Gram-positive bacteria)]|uniref:DUF6349 family protein n=1 Tax=Gordonia sp. (in: high G+C Gram-positive bacteria) TaxID=84139 RepID=UPI003BB59349